MESHFYNVNVKWSNDRKGMMCSPELKYPEQDLGCLQVATPPEFPKGIPGIWSPEHLFTAAVSSCFMTTFLSIAENSKLEFVGFECRSRGKLGKVDGKLQMTEIELEPTVTLMFDSNREKAMRVLQKSESACLITNSIRSKVSVNPNVIVLPKQLAG
jgi:organic hydroperoxide reductase OsmC/OhrA